MTVIIYDLIYVTMTVYVVEVLLTHHACRPSGLIKVHLYKSSNCALTAVTWYIARPLSRWL